MKQVRSSSVEETLALGNTLGQQATQGTVISLRGSLGAGKTIIAKGIAEALHISEAIVSPTFTLVQEYQGSLSLLHLDLYRIASAEEFELMGGEEMLHTNGVTLIEWSEIIDTMLPPHTIFVTLEVQEDQSRIITLEGGSW